MRMVTLSFKNLLVIMRRKMSKENTNNPFDGPAIDINSPEFFDMVSKVMINKHNDPDEDFNLSNG
jgi:hypothetical protein